MEKGTPCGQRDGEGAIPTSDPQPANFAHDPHSRPATRCAPATEACDPTCNPRRQLSPEIAFWDIASLSIIAWLRRADDVIARNGVLGRSDFFGPSQATTKR